MKGTTVKRKAIPNPANQRSNAGIPTALIFPSPPSPFPGSPREIYGCEKKNVSFPRGRIVAIFPKNRKRKRLFRHFYLGSLEYGWHGQETVPQRGGYSITSTWAAW